ncbi:MAG: MFS transporter [Gammaproteobacteria bacterium]|nr:MFS transporter [Gammaproteobacteria bacterium]
MSSSALSTPAYRRFLIGSTITTHGLWILRLSLGWQAWLLTESEFFVAAVAFAAYFPVAVLGPVFGAYADRWDRRRAAQVFNLLNIGVTAGLFGLSALGLMTPAALFLLALSFGVFSGGYTPMRLALMANLVPSMQLASAVGLGAVSFNVARVIGPVLGGYIIKFFGLAPAFALSTATFLGMAWVLWDLKLQPVARELERQIGLARLMRDGLKYTLSHPAIRYYLVLVMIGATFGRALFELMAPYADEVFQRGSDGMSLLISAFGVGAVLGGLFVARNRSLAQLRKWTVVCTALTGLLIVVFGFTGNFWLAMLQLPVFGCVLTICGVGSQTLTQTVVEEKYRGRVMSLWSVVAFGGVALGSAALGGWAQSIGLTTATVYWGGVAAVLGLSALLWLTRIPQPKVAAAS